MIRLVVSFTLLTAAFTWAGPARAAGKKEPVVRIKAVLPKAPVALADVNSGKAKVLLRFENKGKRKVVLWPYVTVTVRDAKGKAVPPVLAVGAGPPARLAEIEKAFLVIPPGKAGQIEVSLRRSFNGTIAMGWKLSRPGKYQVVLHYEFSRKTFKERYFRKPYVLDDEAKKQAEKPHRAWNRALEKKKTIKALLTVK
jgi:hypothetical protein